MQFLGKKSKNICIYQKKAVLLQSFWLHVSNLTIKSIGELAF